MEESEKCENSEDMWTVCKRETIKGTLVKMTSKEKRQLKRPPSVFSEQFMSYVQRELTRCEGASEEERFQIHREVFQYLIEQFNEHRKILCDIKVEYDAAVMRRDAQIRHLIQSERQSAAERERHTRKLKSAQVHAYKQVEEIQEMEAKLRHRLATVCEERQKLKDELATVREAQLVEQKRYQEERKVRLEAENDLCDVTQRYENLLKRVNARPPPDKQSSNTAEDPVVLRVALTKCREELTTATARLVVLETSYTEVVPKRDLKLAQDETERVRAQGEERLAQLQQVLDQERETQVFRTPRPDWSLATHFVPGGEDKWMSLRGTLPSSEVMMTLLHQLSASGPDYFTGLGVEDEVIPPFLKYQGQARNLRMTRQKVVNIICDIFECKEHNEDPFQEFVLEYFKERYPFSWSDWTYSFHFALERLTDNDAHHLLMGLDGAVAETSTPGTPEAAAPPPPPPEAIDSEEDAQRRKSAVPTTSASGRVLSGPERLRVLLEEREKRMSVASAAESARKSLIESAKEAIDSAHTPRTLSASLAGDYEEPREPSAVPANRRPVPELPNRRIQLFWNVLYGVQHEAVYAQDKMAVQLLRKEFSVADADKQGKVLYDSLGRIISETYFGTKTDEEVQRLVLAAAFNNPEMDTVHAPVVETVQYSHFLDTCRETDSVFLQEFYQQMDRAAATYAAQLMEVLSEEEVIQSIVVNQAITQLTPDALPADVDYMCRWICREEGVAVPLDVFEDRLKGLPLPPNRIASGETEPS